MSEATDARPSDEDVQRYTLEQLLEYLSSEEFDRLKASLRDHQNAERPAELPAELPVPEEGRAEASAFLVHYFIGATLQIRDTFAEMDAESLRRLWRRHAIDYAEMVADDVRGMWSEGTVHKSDFYGL